MDIETVRAILRESEVEWSVETAFRRCEAMWMYRGYQEEPHPELTSKKHSNGYFDVNAALQFPNKRETITRLTVDALKNHGISRDNLDFVVSSSEAARPFGQELATQMGVVSIFTEKVGNDQFWTGRFEIPEGARVLQAEELITTLGTTEKVRDAVENSNPYPFEWVTLNGKPLVVTVVHRPTELPITYSDYTVIAVMEKAIQAWEPDQCPICNDPEKDSPVLSFKPNRARFMEFELRYAREYPNG